jgi:HlyD family secretion protein
MKVSTRLAIGLAVAVIVLIVVAVALRRLHSGPAEAEAEAPGEVVQARIAGVSRGRLTEALHLTGTLKTLPNREANVSAQVDGRITDLRVRRGDPVRAGQRIATLYNADLAASAQEARAARQTAQHESQQARAGAAFGRESQSAQLGAANAALTAAQARLDALRAGSRPEEIAEARAALAKEEADLHRLQSGSLPLEIEQADARLREAQAELAQAKAGPRPQEIAQAEAAVREAEANVEVAGKEAQRVHSLFESGLASTKEKEQAAADLTAAQSALQTAQEQLKLLQAGTRTEEVQAQEAKVREAQAALQLARDGPRPEEIEAQAAAVEEARHALAKLVAGPRPQEIREAEADVGQAQATLASAKAGRWEARSTELGAAAAGSKAQEASASVAVADAELGKTDVISPVTGVVAAVFVNRGEVVSVGEPIVQVVNARALRVVAQVPAAHQSLVHVGLAATVTFPHLPGEKVETGVEVVGSVADTETGLLPIELFVPNEAARLADGMAAEVALKVDRPGESLLVPATAVFGRAGESYVYVVDAENKAHERLVETGTEAKGMVEIRSGLKLGERVVADGTISIADGVEVRPLP